MSEVVDLSEHAKSSDVASRKTILVLYYTRGVYPLRTAISDHLYCWSMYSNHRVFYLNVAFGVPENLIHAIRPDVVIYHTTFCGMRWSRDVFERYTASTHVIHDLPALKIAMPQDEFIHTNMLCGLLKRCDIDWILTCAEASEWAKIYGDLDQSKTRYKTVLTGYLDSETIKRCDTYVKPIATRSIDVSYRAWRAAYWLGSHGSHKVRVGEVFRKAASARGMRVDISLDDEATFLGDDWLRFLADSVATVGVEGGASILDADGSIKVRVEAYVAQNPNATFEEAKRACFERQDGNLRLACISPRHLEAVATRTCQVLVEGDYSGLLVPDRHFIAVKPDYSNVQEALDKLQNAALVEEMIETAYREIVASNKVTYQGFVAEIENSVIATDHREPVASGGLSGYVSGCLLIARDRLAWWFIKTEVWLLANPNNASLVGKAKRALASLSVRSVLR